jgi:hypothetical protein
MSKITVLKSGWTDYKGCSLRFEPELNLVLVRRDWRVYFVKSWPDARIVAKALAILDDPAIAVLREAITEGAVLSDAFSVPSNSSKH